MRHLSAVLAVGIATLALGTGFATAGDNAFQCSTVGARVVCFDAWGTYHQTTAASGNQVTIDNYHRHFVEYTNGVMTFEQRDMGHNVIVTKAGETHVSNHQFTGWSTPSGLLCKWKEQLIVRDGDVLHSVNDFSCASS